MRKLFTMIAVLVGLVVPSMASAGTEVPPDTCGNYRLNPLPALTAYPQYYVDGVHAGNSSVAAHMYVYRNYLGCPQDSSYNYPESATMAGAYLKNGVWTNIPLVNTYVSGYAGGTAPSFPTTDPSATGINHVDWDIYKLNWGIVYPNNSNQYIKYTVPCSSFPVGSTKVHFAYMLYTASGEDHSYQIFYTVDTTLSSACHA